MSTNVDTTEIFRSKILGIFIWHYYTTFRQGMNDDSYFGLLIEILKTINAEYFDIAGKTDDEIMNIIKYFLKIEYNMEQFTEFGYGGIIVTSGNNLDISPHIYLNDSIVVNKFLFVKGLSYLPIFIRKLSKANEPFDINEFSLIVTDLKLVCRSNYMVMSVILSLYVLALFLIHGVSDYTKNIAAKFAYRYIQSLTPSSPGVVDEDVKDFDSALKLFNTSPIISDSNVIMLFPFWIVCNYSTILDADFPNLKSNCDHIRTQTFEHVSIIGAFLDKYFYNLDHSNSYNLAKEGNIQGIQLLDEAISIFISNSFAN